MVLEFRPFDADHHYYEPLDAFFDRLAARPPRSSGT